MTHTPPPPTHSGTHLTKSCSWLFTRHDTTVAPEPKMERPSLSPVLLLPCSVLPSYLHLALEGRTSHYSTPTNSRNPLNPGKNKRQKPSS
ncbi:hypothetical protein E2C01_010440 [Portunus trituberculatus]|uniref:Uncharacterized protein n=1 Tax=Portunus trituberculatus TaxID=210409 RepID=A0A5B7D8D7_PORTR|nr:hypothetical protein [Portunus trituberculatus]